MRHARALVTAFVLLLLAALGGMGVGAFTPQIDENAVFVVVGALPTHANL